MFKEHIENLKILYYRDTFKFIGTMIALMITCSIILLFSEISIYFPLMVLPTLVFLGTSYHSFYKPRIKKVRDKIELINSYSIFNDHFEVDKVKWITCLYNQDFSSSKVNKSYLLRIISLELQSFIEKGEVKFYIGSYSQNVTDELEHILDELVKDDVLSGYSMEVDKKQPWVNILTLYKGDIFNT